jgi:5-oxoprolinase (ATP-hydrolysing)
MPDACTWVDRGGTFTDVIRWDGLGAPQVEKVRSDEAVVGRLARGRLVFGTTVATNALLERAGVPTLLVVTEGFADLPELRHMARPSLFDPDQGWPAPLCTRVVELPGRLDAHGREIEPLVLPERWDLAGIEAVAVVLLNSHKESAHELAVARALAGHGLSISLGHEVDPELGYLARVETTLVDAALAPVLREALLRDEIPEAALAMRSDGGLIAAHALRPPDAVLSGPAGGVLAVEAIARQAGLSGAIGLDMGGTSTDVCCVQTGRLPRRHGDVPVAGVVVRRPMLEVETIAAGGGSILETDGVSLRVGPASAGADPGPQCYGRGGPPTLTDAALSLGLLDAAAFSPPLDPLAVRLPGPAEAFLDVAREAIAAAVRRIAAARGVDLRALALVAYGGAAGAHAAAVAERLGMDTVLVHPFAAVLSAWGQTLAREQRTRVWSFGCALTEAWPRVQAVRDEPWAGDQRELTLELRTSGTEQVIEVQFDAQHALDAALRGFAGEHQRLYGFAASGAVELVNLRERVWEAATAVPPGAADPWGLGPRVLIGPSRLDCPTTSVFVPAGWSARLERGLLTLSRLRSAAASDLASDTRSPHGVALWSSRFIAVATEAGEVLRRLARSVNIRERLDFSCAVFDERGQLVANAPHIPVHLGAMGETVRDLLASGLDLDGQSWLGNDPAAGGSHLPDLTVVTPVRSGAHRWFVACRGHHVDVGGSTPGSMPPRSRALDEEGLVFRRAPLLQDGELRDLRTLLHGCRQPEVVAADLRAQLAANAHAARLLTELGSPGLISAWMAHLQDAAAESLAAAIPSVREGEACDVIDGVPLRLRVSQRAGRLRLDLTGTGGPHPGNLNAPPAVLRASVLYALRVWIGAQLPLNEGALRQVDLVVPSPSIVHAPGAAAVAGGNVETSQRIVDLLFQAMDLRAASQGTMNNLTLGGEGWSHYETIGGGGGASAARAGRHASQVHMTNTRATDPEVLEARSPLRVRRFTRRRGSGGVGEQSGGDGIEREIEVLYPTLASLLATRRERGASGAHGGGAGLPGEDAVRRGGRWQPWDGATVALEAGDRVRVRTPGGGAWGAPGEPF